MLNKNDHLKKPVKRFYSSFDILMSLFWRALCLFVIIYSLPSFSENPPVITAVCLIMLFFIALFGTEEVDLYHDRLVQKDFSLLSLILGSQRRSVLYDEVDSFSMQPYINETSEGVAYIILRALTKKRRAGRDDRDILITWKDGRVEHFTTALGEDTAIEIVECANELLKQYKRGKRK
jgi:hypothetical protein